jgi:hypothetical protein
MDNLIDRLNDLTLKCPEIKNELDTLVSHFENINFNDNVNESDIKDIIVNLSKIEIINEEVKPIIILYIKDYFHFLYRKEKCMNNMFEITNNRYVY